MFGEAFVTGVTDDCETAVYETMTDGWTLAVLTPATETPGADITADIAEAIIAADEVMTGT